MSQFTKKVYPNFEKKNLNQRVDELERLTSEFGKTLEETIKQVNQAFRTVDVRFNESRSIINGLIHLLGEEKVKDAVAEAAAREAEDQSNRQLANIKTAVEAGNLVEAGEVHANTIIVGTETKPDGTTTRPLHNVVAFHALTENVQSLLTGKKKGESIVIPGSDPTFTITSIYELVVKKEESSVEEKAPTAEGNS